MSFKCTPYRIGWYPSVSGALVFVLYRLCKSLASLHSFRGTLVDWLPRISAIA